MFFAQAQSTDFTQSFTNYVYVNPAMAGAMHCPRLYTSYRYKKYLEDVTYSSNYASFDMFLAPINSDIAISFISDIDSRRNLKTSFYGVLAQEFKLKEKLYFKAGVSIGGGIFEANSAGLIFPDMLDPLLGIYKESSEQFFYYTKFFFDSEVGVMFFNKDFFSGLTIKHINHVSLSDKKKLRPYVPQLSLQVGTKHATNNGFAGKRLFVFYPHLNITTSIVGTYIQLGAIVQKEKLNFGLGYRQNLPIKGESFIIFVGFVEKKFKFAYNCDVTIKTKGGGNFNTHEVSLSYLFDCGKKRRKYESVKAPIY